MDKAETIHLKGDSIALVLGLPLTIVGVDKKDEGKEEEVKYLKKD